MLADWTRTIMNAPAHKHALQVETVAIQKETGHAEPEQRSLSSNAARVGHAVMP